VRFQLGFYITEDGILHRHRCENLKSYISLTSWALQRRRNAFPVRYELGFISQKTAFFVVTAVKPKTLHNYNIVGFNTVTFTWGDPVLYLFEALCYKQLDSGPFHSHYGSGVDSESNRIETANLPESTER
jgi:hypothetical protein